MKKTVLGIDIGGTNIKFICVEYENGSTKELYKHSMAMVNMKGDHDSRDRKLNCVADFAKELQKCHKIDNIDKLGIAVPGIVDQRTGEVKCAYNLGITGASLYDIFKRTFPSVEIKALNDADAATYAEFKSGSLRDVKNACLLTLGTGLGAGLIINGELYLGGRRRGTEPGHMIVDKSGNAPCTCGENGCAEALSSASYFKRRSLELLGVERDPEELFKLSERGDKKASTIVSEYIDNLTTVIASIVNILDPEVIALGGGIASAGSALFDSLQSRVDEKCFFEDAGSIRPAQLCCYAGALGAALWALEH